MTKLVPISGKDLCKILEKMGFMPIRAKGSHIRFKHSDGRRTVVPVHSNEKIGLGLLQRIRTIKRYFVPNFLSGEFEKRVAQSTEFSISAILRQIKITREDYENLRSTV